MSDWTFLTNHAQVLISIAQDQGSTAREIAVVVGITERAVQRIISDLEAGGYIRKFKDGRRNYYEIDTDKPMRHPQQHGHIIRELLALIDQPRHAAP